jgi:HK97 family phage major capsid protein
MSTAALKEQYRKLALDAHQVVTDKSLTPAEAAEKYEPMEADLKALSEEIAASEKVDAAAKSLGAILSDTTPPDEPEPSPEPAATVKSLGEQFTESAAFKSFVDALKAGGSSLSSGPIELKATLTESGLGSSNVINQQRLPGILPILFQPLTVADLMPSGTASSNLIRYVQESTATNAASTVAEGGAKPEATLNFTVVDEPVRKIAVTFKVTDEMLEDFDQISSYINGRLALFVQQREEQQLLTGNGLSPDLTGILNRSGLTAAQAKSSDSVADAVHKEITKIRVASFLDPTALVFHPNDWEAALLEKDSQNRYYGPSPFQAQGTPTYWGLPVVSTQAMTENTVLVGAFATAAQVFRRTGVTVDMTNSNEDDFKKNLVAIRAEERVALAVYRPAGFGTVTGV